MHIQDAPFATLLVLTEKMEHETRQMFYVRRVCDDAPIGFVGTYGVATVQGQLWRGT